MSNYRTGIYKITNTVTGKIYIGSSVRIDRRFNSHKSQLNGNYHVNNYLQNAWNKYGHKSFIFERIENVKDKSLLLEREQYYLDKMQPFYDTGNGYNILKVAGSHLGAKRSEETKKKMSKWERTDEIKEKIRKANTCVPKTEVTKANMKLHWKKNPPLGDKNPFSKRVYQYDFETGYLVRKWGSVNEVFRELGWTVASIRNNCNLKPNKNGEIISFKDYIWSWTPIKCVETHIHNHNITKKYKYLGTNGSHHRNKK
jgi:group I intron endonuclease